MHLDTKKLGRIDGVGKRFGGPKRSRALGWDVVHVAIDDHSRLAYAEQLPDEHGATAAAFLERALGSFAAHGIAVTRVMTDNGSPYISGAFAGVLAERGIRHLRTRPYTPRTNGKAEAMVKVLIKFLGLRPSLRELSSTGRCPVRVHRLLQSGASTWRLERHTTDRPDPSMMPLGSTASRRIPSRG